MSSALLIGILAVGGAATGLMAATQQGDPTSQVMFLESPSVAVVCHTHASTKPLIRNLTTPYEERQFILDTGELCEPQ